MRKIWVYDTYDESLVSDSSGLDAMEMGMNTEAFSSLESVIKSCITSIEEEILEMVNSCLPVHYGTIVDFRAAMRTEFSQKFTEHGILECYDWKPFVLAERDGTFTLESPIGLIYTIRSIQVQD